MVQNSMVHFSLRCCPAVALPSPCRHLTPPWTVTAIAIGVVVFVIPIGAAATIDVAIRMRCCRRHVWAPIGGVVHRGGRSSGTAAPAVGRDGPNGCGID